MGKTSIMEPRQMLRRLLAESASALAKALWRFVRGHHIEGLEILRLMGHSIAGRAITCLDKQRM